MLSLSAGGAAQGDAVAEQGTTAIQHGWPGDVNVNVNTGGKVPESTALKAHHQRFAFCATTELLPAVVRTSHWWHKRTKASRWPSHVGSR